MKPKNKGDKGGKGQASKSLASKSINNVDGDPIQNIIASLVQEQLKSIMQPQNPRPRLSSKRRMSDSNDEDDDGGDHGINGGASSGGASGRASGGGAGGSGASGSGASGGGGGASGSGGNNINPSSKRHKQSVNQADSTDYNAQVVLLDGIHENLKSNPTKFLKALRSLKPDLEIKSVRKTASGSMLIHPKQPKDCNSLLKKDAFVPNSILGPNVTARLPKSQTITHQVIIKQIDPEVTEDEVKEMLTRQQLPFTHVKRIISRQRDAPTEMMRLFLKDEAKKKHLLKNGIYLDQMHFRCVAAKEDTEKKLVFQCFNCQQWNDHKTFDCKNETKCVICAESHRKSECPKQKADASCANCKGSHPAWSTVCPSYQSEVEKKKSYSSITVETMKSPSFITESIEPIIFGILETLKKQLAVMISEVVSKALLEHIFYEGESRRTNGATYLGATARVSSIVKMSTQAVNSCPLHESDKSNVVTADVHTEVMKRLQSLMTTSTAPKSQSTPNAKASTSNQ